jgi:NADH:ubiquinone oxidoreductase subunit 6 (subunit J)
VYAPLVDERLFYIYYVAIMGVYVFSVMGILSTLYKEKWTLNKQVVFFALFLWVHARWALRISADRVQHNSWGHGQYLME